MIKKSFKKSIALFISILMIITSLPFATMSAQAATGTLNVDQFGVVAASGCTGQWNTRLNGNVMNVTNDGGDTNTSAGIISFSLANMQNKNIDSATLNIKATSMNDHTPVGVYFTYSANPASYVSSTGKYTTGGSFGNSTNGNAALLSYLDTLGSSILYKVGEVAADNNSNNQFDVKNAVQGAVNNGASTIYFIIMLTTYDGSTGDPWSDSTFDKSNQTLAYSVSDKDFTRSDVATVKSGITDTKLANAPYKGNVNRSQDGSYTNSDLTGGDQMANVLWTYGVKDNWSTSSDSNYAQFGLQYGSATLLYDGVNPMGFPVTFFIYRTSSLGRNYNQKPISLALQSTNALELKHIWHGCVAGSSGYVKDTTYGVNIVNTNTFSSPASKDLSGIGTNDYYANTLYVNPNGLTFTNNVATIQSVTWKLFYCDNGSNNGRFSNTVTCNNANQVIRVINYKPIYDAITKAKEIYNTVKNDELSYCPNDLYKFYNAFDKLLSFNPNNYFAYNSNNYEACVSAMNVASAYISDATSMLTKSNRVYTHSYSNGQAMTTSNKHTLHCNDCGEDIEEACTWNAGETTTEATCTTDGVTTFTCTLCGGTGTSVITATGTHTLGDTWTHVINGQNHYKQCSECKQYFYENCNKVEVPDSAVAGTCAQAGKNVDLKCSECDTIYTGATTVKDPGNHVGGTVIVNDKEASFQEAGYTGDTKCLGCDEIIANGSEISKLGDYTAYNAAKSSAAVLVESDYNPTTWAALQTALNADLTQVTSQADIDAITSAIEEAITGLKPADVYYTVRVVEEDENGATTVKTDSVKEGSAYVAVTENELDVVKWTVETADTTKKIGTNEKEVTAIINGDTTFTVYLANDVVVTNTNIKVTYVGYSGNITSVEYYASEDAIATDCDSHQTSVAFYAFDGWSISKVSDNEYIYTATYAPATTGVTANVVSSDSAEVLVNKSAQTNAYYDSVVFLSGDKNKVVKMVADGKVSYFKNVGYMHVPYANSVEISLVDSAPASSAITGQYKDVDETGATVAAFNANFYLPEDAELVECGAIMTVRDYVAVDTDAFQIGTAKVIKVASKSQSDVNEYTIAFHGNFTGFDNVYGRSYVTYTVGGVQYTEYSAVSTLAL